MAADLSSGVEDLRARHDAMVRAHMVGENEHRWDDVTRTLAPGRARNELIALHHADDVVVAEFWLRGTDTGGRTSTGRPFEARMVALFEFEAGGDAMVCERVYWDRETVTRQLRPADS